MKSDSVKAKSGLDLQRQRDAKFAALSTDVEVARRRAGKIRDGLRSWATTRDAIIEAFQKQDWFTLGYTSWDDYCDTEFSGSKLNLSAEDRRDAILAFAEVGMTLREIGSAAGTSKDTAQRTLARSRVSDETELSQVKTSGAVPPASTEDASLALGEPDVDDMAASTSGTPTAAEGSHSPDADAAEAPIARADEVAAPDGGEEEALPSGVTQDSPTGQEEPGDAGASADATAGRSETGSPVVADQPIATEARPGIDHHDGAGVSPRREALPEESRPSGALELEDGGTAQDTPSSSDPDDEDDPQPIDLVLRTAEALVGLLDHIDVDAVAPMLFPAELEQLHQHSEALAAFVAKVSRVRFAEMIHTP